MNGKDILLKLKELQPVLEREFAVNRIGIFGSYAEKKSSEASDIDLLVEFNGPVGWKFFSLEIFLEKIFGKKIDLVTIDAIRANMKKEILQQVIYP